MPATVTDTLQYGATSTNASAGGATIADELIYSMSPGNMPDLSTIAIGTDVEDWWDAHPLNPASANYISYITSPPLLIDVAADYANNLQNAIDALPAVGGTLILDDYTYPHVTVTNKSNVHFIGKSKAGTILRGVSVYGKTITVSYVGWLIDICAKTAPALLAANDRPRNFYFHNLTFDGDGVTLDITDQTVTNGALWFRGVKDIIIDDCIVTNYLDVTGWGAVGCNGLADGLFAINTTFDCYTHYALYADGVHGSGCYNCTFTINVKYSAVITLCNNDYTADYNQNHNYEDNFEKRAIQYCAFVNNKIYHGNTDVCKFAGGYALVKDNIFYGADQTIGDFVEFGAGYFSPPYDAVDPLLTNKGYYAYYIVIKDNEIEGTVQQFLHANGLNCVEDGIHIVGHCGKYTVTGNHVGAISNVWIFEEGTVDGPNTVSGNTEG